MSTNDRNPFGYSDSERAAWAQDIDPGGCDVYQPSHEAEFAALGLRVGTWVGLQFGADGGAELYEIADPDEAFGRVTKVDESRGTATVRTVSRAPMTAWSSDEDELEDEEDDPEHHVNLTFSGRMKRSKIDALTEAFAGAEHQDWDISLDPPLYPRVEQNRTELTPAFDEAPMRYEAAIPIEFRYTPEAGWTVVKSGDRIEKMTGHIGAIGMTPGERVTVETQTPRGFRYDGPSMSIDVEPCAKRVTYEKGHPINVECACNGLRGERCTVLNPPKE